MFNPFKFVFGSLISWVILLVLIGGGYLLWVTAQAQQYTPTRIMQSLESMIENPTEVVTSSEEDILKNSIDSKTLSRRKLEEVILALRQLQQTMPVSVWPVETEGKFASGQLRFENIYGDNPTIDVFMEEYGEWYTGKKHRIIHLEFTGFDSIDSNLEKTFRDTLEEFRDDAVEGFNTLKDNYGGKLLELLPNETETPLGE